MGMIDHKEYARQMRTHAVADAGDIRVSTDLWEQIADIIENSEEVVRCKVCKHSSYDPVHGDYWCGGQRVFAEHFCSVGERREGE